METASIRHASTPPDDVSAASAITLQRPAAQMPIVKFLIPVRSFLMIRAAILHVMISAAIPNADSIATVHQENAATLIPVEILVGHVPPVVTV